jgi:hypothetical protein
MNLDEYIPVLLPADSSEAFSELPGKLQGEDLS